MGKARPVNVRYTRRFSYKLTGPSPTLRNDRLKALLRSVIALRHLLPYFRNILMPDARPPVRMSVGFSRVLTPT
jgi:hypothetical protein